MFAGNEMKAKRNKGDYFWIAYAALNLVLLVTAVCVGLLSFFASLEIVLTIGAQVIWGSLGDTLQGKYALVTIRNLWLILGGLLLLGVIIYCINTFFKHWRDMRVHRVYIYLLAVEALIILAAQVLTAP